MRNSGEETVRIELMVRIKYQRAALIRAITVKIFKAKAKAKLRYGSEKIAEAVMPTLDV